MAKKQSHDKWMADQFKTPKGQYRDALLHASFIEGVVFNKSKSTRRDFYHAIQWLHIHKKITDEEREVFHEVREARNKLVHHIIKKEASQTEIEQWRDDLVIKVLKAYWMSRFVYDELFTRYNIPRSDLTNWMCKFVNDERYTKYSIPRNDWTKQSPSECAVR